MVRNLGDKIPRIAESAFVSEAAYVIGDVDIGENSSVWPGAVIRGDFGKIRIGKNTAVEDNAVLHEVASMSFARMTITQPTSLSIAGASRIIFT